MRSSRDLSAIVAVAMAAVVLAGLVLSYAPGLYTHDISFEEGDGTVTVTYDSNAGIQTNTVVISNSGEYRITYVAAYADESYASLNDWDLQLEMYEDLEIQLSIRGISGFGVHDAESLLEVIETHEPTQTALVIASGALPDTIYNGELGCPLMEWLERGGIVVNIAGCLGKYVSQGPEAEDIVELEEFAWMFGEFEDSDFMDSPSRLLAGAGCNEQVRDALHVYMDECTYGIDLGGMYDALNLGYVSEDGYSAACVFRSGQGMVFNFGVVLSTHEHSDHYIAQILASGIDYTSDILSSTVGDTYGDPVVTVEAQPSCSVYAFIGSTRAEYAERYDVTFG